jgi:hypothetical protein
MSGVVTVVAPTAIAAVGAPSTEHLMDHVVSGPSIVNVHAHPASNTTVPSDSFCALVTYTASTEAGTVLSPPTTDAGRDALRESVAGSYPDATSDAGKGCVDIARSDAAPRAVGPAGDNPTFEYYAYALDAVTWATTSLHAPSALTQTQLQAIYNCSDTDWAQVGGAPGPIQRILPPDGSGLLDDFLVEDLGVSSVAALPASGPACPPIERIGEDQAYDLFHGSSVFGPVGDAAAYANAILPFSAGTWIAESFHDTNPTLDLRAGARPGAVIVARGGGTVDAYAVAWTGSNWALNDGTVVGNTTQVHTIAAASFVAGSATVTAPAGTFAPGDVAKILDSPDAFLATTVTAVAPDGSSVTIAPAAKVTGTGTAWIGNPVVSEGTIAAASGGAGGPFPGAHYVYNVIDTTEPSYAAALALVGFRDTAGGTASPLCTAGHTEDLFDAGFLPLAARTSPGGNVGVTCVRQQPS